MSTSTTSNNMVAKVNIMWNIIMCGPCNAHVNDLIVNCIKCHGIYSTSFDFLSICIGPLEVVVF